MNRFRIHTASPIAAIAFGFLLWALGCQESASQPASGPAEQSAGSPQAAELQLAVQAAAQAAAEKSSAEPAPKGAPVRPGQISEKDSPFAGIKPKEDEPERPPMAPPRDLGPPLVDDVKELVRLHPVYPTWINSKRKQVVMQGEVCRSTILLEMFATTRRAEKDYESVVVIDTEAKVVHAALVALGAEPGAPVSWAPKYSAPWGPVVEVEIRWKDAKGQLHKARAQDWVRNVQTRKPLDSQWVFTGSGFFKDDLTGKTYYQADEGGYFICVANTPGAMLDLPIPSSGGLETREYEPFKENIPPKNTSITMVLTPQPKNIIKGEKPAPKQGK